VILLTLPREEHGGIISAARLQLGQGVGMWHHNRMRFSVHTGQRRNFLRAFLASMLIQKSGHFAPVRINDTLTLLFDEHEEFESHHYAFHVSDAEFDAILGRIREAKLAYGQRTVEPRRR
jgi:hypothetical protein